MILKARSAAATVPRRLGLAIIFLSALAGAGCKNFGPSETLTPSVTGRVLAADTQQPLAGVQVSRVVPGQNPATPAKGAQLLQQTRPAVTGTDGAFVLTGREYLTLFARASWWSVRLAFQAPGYVPLQTNYTAAGFPNQTAADPARINVGDVFLKPGAK